MSSIINVDGLSKSFKVQCKKEGLMNSVKGFFKREYRVVNAVKNISFSIEPGEIVGFIGPNGAGKTTTLKMLSGLLYPTSGQARVLGNIPWERKNRYLQKVSLVMGQRNQLWWDIPAYDSFILNRDIYMIPEKEFRNRVEEMSELLDATHVLHVPVRNLSLGERMKMEIIASLLHSPEVVFLDEPTIGLDSMSQKKLRTFISEYNKKYGTTILLTSHYFADITSLCERIIVINHGEIVYDGSLSNLKNWNDSYKVVRLQFATQPGEEFVKKYSREIKEQKENEFIMNLNRNDISNFISEITSWMPIDFSIEDQPIEDLIESIYTGVSSNV